MNNAHPIRSAPTAMTKTMMAETWLNEAILATLVHGSTTGSAQTRC